MRQNQLLGLETTQHQNNWFNVLPLHLIITLMDHSELFPFILIFFTHQRALISISQLSCYRQKQVSLPKIDFIYWKSRATFWPLLTAKQINGQHKSAFPDQLTTNSSDAALFGTHCSGIEKTKDAPLWNRFAALTEYINSPTESLEIDSGMYPPMEWIASGWKEDVLCHPSFFRLSIVSIRGSTLELGILVPAWRYVPISW